MTSWQGILRAIISLSLFAFVVYLLSKHIEGQKMLSLLRQCNLAYLFLALLCMASRYLFLAIRWQYASGVGGLKVPFLFLAKAEFEIIFLGLLLPFPNSDDLFRVMFTQSKGAQLPQSFSIVLFDRICGMMMLLLLLPFSWFFFYQSDPLDSQQRQSVIFLVMAIIALGVVFHKKIINLIAGGLRHLKKSPETLVKGLKQLGEYHFTARNYSIGVFFAGVHYLSETLCIYMLGMAFGEDISLLMIVSMLPLLTLSFILPLSVHGLGLGEAAMAWLLPMGGMKVEPAAGIAIMHFGCLAVLIVTGALIFSVSSQERFGDIKKSILLIRDRARGDSRGGAKL